LLRFCYFSVLYLAISSSLSAQLKLYQCISDVDSTAKGYLKKSGFKVAYILDDRYIDPNHNERVDSALFTEAVLKIVPENAKDEIGVLDWEGESLKKLHSLDCKDREFIRCENEFLKAIRIAKRLRPKVKWGFYAIPFSHYWVNDSLQWAKANSNIGRLISACDILLPSLYDYYFDSTPNTDNYRYLSVNTAFFLTAASRYKKKVYPFIWHRVHDSNKTNGLELLSTEEFKEHLLWILRQNKNSKHIDGFVWFSADAYYYRIRPQVYVKENYKKLPFDEYYSSTIQRYARVLKDVAERIKVSDIKK
jgi:hypothetical protein